jgi:hypothetical protein
MPGEEQAWTDEDDVTFGCNREATVAYSFPNGGSKEYDLVYKVITADDNKCKVTVEVNGTGLPGSPIPGQANRKIRGICKLPKDKEFKVLCGGGSGENPCHFKVFVRVVI